MSLRVLVTGASGLVGRALCLRAVRDGQVVRGALRRAQPLPTGVEAIEVGDIDGQTDWSSALQGMEVVVHLAARVHILKERAQNPWIEFKRVNVDGTICLARQAAACGVKRFIFVSSIKVNGEQTLDQPFRSTQKVAPGSLYAQSKYEAEQGLATLAANTNLEVVIIRPPLIYGPGALGNFGLLVRALSLGVPLPLEAVTNNRRSFIALDNLVDLIRVCLTHPAAVNKTFLVGDGEDLSTADLVRRMGHALHQPARLWSLPPSILRLGLRLLGQGAIASRLLDSLQVDSAETCTLLGWRPPVTVDEGLSRALNLNPAVDR